MARTTAEKIKVMQGFEQGKTIQYKHTDNYHWTDLSNYLDIEPEWDWGEFDYRIKPEIKRVELHWSVLLKNNGVLITTNPKPIAEHERCLLQYADTAKVIKSYSDFFTLPIDLFEDN